MDVIGTINGYGILTGGDDIPSRLVVGIHAC
jgi:hypothetical protein